MLLAVFRAGQPHRHDWLDEKVFLALRFLSKGRNEYSMMLMTNINSNI